jgi:hypothetical protein
MPGRIFVERAAIDRLLPDAATQFGDQLLRRAFEQDAAFGQHRHARAKVRDIVDDVGGENDNGSVADLGEQVEKAIALFRIEAGRGLVDDQQAGSTDQRLRDAEALAHAARETC